MPHAVAVVSRETMEQQGSTQLVDLFKNLSVSHGVIGERNSWYNSNQPATLTENVANVNLRGFGASRTLVLFNGRRHVGPRASHRRAFRRREHHSGDRGRQARGAEGGRRGDLRLRRGRWRRQLRDAKRFSGVRAQRLARLLRQRRRYDRLRYLGWTDRRASVRNVERAHVKPALVTSQLTCAEVVRQTERICPLAHSYLAKLRGPFPGRLRAHVAATRPVGRDRHPPGRREAETAQSACTAWLREGAKDSARPVPRLGTVRL